MVTSVRRLVSLLPLFLASPILSAGENIWTTNGPAGSPSVLAIAPSAPALFAGITLDGRTQAFRSIDFGSSWTLLAETTNAAISAFAADPFLDGTVYAATIRTPYLGEGGDVFRSSDGGSTWSRLASLSGPRIRSIVPDPSEPGTLYAASNWCRCFQAPCFPYFICTSTVLRSRDSGATWSFRDTGLSATGAACMAIDPLDPSRIYAGGGIGVAVSPDRGEHWTSSSAGLEACPTILAVAVRSTDGALFAGSGQIFSNRFECGGISRSLDRGRTWTTTGFSPHYVTSIAIDPTNPETVYAGTARVGFFSPDGGVFRSLDGGQTWAPFGSGLPPSGVSQVVIDPTGRTVHAGTSEGVFDYEVVPGARPPVLPPRNHGTKTLPPRP